MNIRAMYFVDVRKKSVSEKSQDFDLWLCSDDTLQHDSKDETSYSHSIIYRLLFCRHESLEIVDETFYIDCCCYCCSMFNELQNHCY